MTKETELLAPPGEKRPALSDICYNDYILLACHMDAEWSRQRHVSKEGSDRGSFLISHKYFATNCCAYRDKIDRNYHAFEQAHGRKPTEPLAAYLFNPMSFVPFGHADDLSVVLLDDFDPVYFLASRARTTTEEICLAFCPKAESYRPKGSEDIFCDPHTLLGTNPLHPQKDANNPAEYWPATHQFQQEMPLLFFTKYKIHALGALGQGMLFVESLYRAMAVKIMDTISSLRRSVTLGPLGDGLIPEEDLAPFKCVFLDLQGPEEIGIMTFCRNYSVAKAGLLALRSLTFGDIFDTSQDLAGLLGRCKSHRAILSIDQAEGRELLDLKRLRGLHVFRWTHSSLAIAPQAFFEPEHPNCGGYVGALLEFQVSPGHFGKVEPAIQTVLNEPRGRGSGKILDSQEYHLAQVGAEDMTIPYSADPKKRQLPVEPLRSVLDVICHNLRTFGTKEPSGDTGRDVVDSRTTIMVPVPKRILTASGEYQDLTCERVEEGHFSPLVNTLPVLRQRLCYPAETPAEQPKDLGPDAGRLDVPKLYQIPLALGIPLSLRRTIEDLYKHFAILLGDPFLFDTVLDLYDTLATLHTVLTKHLPQARTQEPGATGDRVVAVLEEARVEQLALLVAAIQNGLVHRVLKMYAETPIRELPIDLRGGLNQILLAADAPVKCGLGLLRKYAMSVDEDEPRYDCVGGLTRISPMPGARCHSFSFGIEDSARLAVFEADVPHVVNINTYCENLHESFHLIWSALCHRKSTQGGPFAISEPVMADRVSEVFANLLTYLFVFDRDKDAFLYHQFCVFSQSLSSVGRDDGEVVIRLTEVAMRLFAVVEIMPEQGQPLTDRGQEASIGTNSRAALARFTAFLEKFGPFFSDYERLWTQKRSERAVRHYVRRQFRRIYRKLFAFLPQIGEEARDVYQSFLQREVCCQRSQEDSELYRSEHMMDHVQRAFQEGRPLIRGLYQDPDCHAMDADDTHECMSPFTLVCLMLNHYVRDVKSASGKAIHLHRRSTGEVIYDGNRPWYEFQVEKGATAMFCPVPAARRMRLKKEIVVLKTLWDISSNLRERRFWALLADNWPTVRELMKRQSKTEAPA